MYGQKYAMSENHVNQRAFSRTLVNIPVHFQDASFFPRQSRTVLTMELEMVN